MRKRQTDRQPLSSPPSHQNLDTCVIWEKQSKHFSLTKQLFIVVSFPHLDISVIKDQSKYTSLKIILKQIYKCQVKTICQSFVHFFLLLFVLMERCCLKILEPEKLGLIWYHNILFIYRQSDLKFLFSLYKIMMNIYWNIFLKQKITTVREHMLICR